MFENSKVSAAKRDKKQIAVLTKGLLSGDFRLFSKKNILDKAKLMQTYDTSTEIPKDVVIVMDCRDNHSTYNGVRFASFVEMWQKEDYLQARNLAIELKDKEGEKHEKT